MRAEEEAELYRLESGASAEKDVDEVPRRVLLALPMAAPENTEVVVAEADDEECMKKARTLYFLHRTHNAHRPRLEPWCVEVSRVSGGVGQCRGSVEAVSVDTGVGVSGSVGLQCRGSVGAP